MKPDIHELTIRIPKELWISYKKSAIYARKSLNSIICEALEARKTFVEKKYIPDVDRSK